METCHPRKRHSLITVCFLIGLAGCSCPARFLVPAPTVLPDVSRQMKTAGYWIGRHPDPDNVLMDPERVTAFNDWLDNDLHLTTDIAAFPAATDAGDLSEELGKQWRGFTHKPFYRADGKTVETSFFARIKDNMNFPPAGETIPVRFGFVVHYADQRLLPVDDILTASPGDIDFDELQNSSLDVGSPVAILWKSRDAQWFYTRGRSSSGWIRKDCIAVGRREDVRGWQERRPFVVTLEPKTDIYLDQDRRDYYDYARMGSTFPLTGEESDGFVEVLLPTRDGNGRLVMREGYLNSRDVREGYLTYTPRHILEQAFKLLNAPYGWGGMYGEQDCSRFLKEIFATVGLHLPRNSGAQINVNPALAVFDARSTLEDKMNVLRSPRLGGVAVLYFKGHILLYLGTVDGEPFAIHDTWAYRVNDGPRETVHVINKVVVSSLRLGGDSKKGSLLSRLEKIMTIAVAPTEGGCPCSSHQ